MKRITTMALFAGITCSCLGEELLKQYDWEKMPGPAGTTQDGRRAALVTNANDTPLQVQLLVISNPPITKMLYAIVGEVKYEGVKGTGYLEMWNYYPSVKAGMFEGAYFSRTLAESGDLGKIS